MYRRQSAKHKYRHPSLELVQLAIWWVGTAGSKIPGERWGRNERHQYLVWSTMDLPFVSWKFAHFVPSSVLRLFKFLMRIGSGSAIRFNATKSSGLQGSHMGSSMKSRQEMWWWNTSFPLIASQSRSFASRMARIDGNGFPVSGSRSLSSSVICN